jgi:electron transfer flavoprotein beta subunit
MKIAVCIKQVPNTEARLRVGRDGRWVDEEDLPFVINESDEYALEEGLRIAEKTGGEVVVFSLGPERVKEALRKALAVGAARAVHLSDPAFAGGDALATGRALAAALARDQYDLVLTGSQSDDVGFGGTGSVIAGHLGWPHVWLVMGVELEEGNASAKVTREMESGVNEVSRVRLPAVLEIQAGLNHPRYASLKGIMAAKKKEIATASPADLGLDPSAVGEAGSRLEIVSVSFPSAGKGAQMLEGDAKAAAAKLVDKLQKEARVL